MSLCTSENSAIQKLSIIIIIISTGPCECLAKGDPHYTTFDGAHIELYEDCKYLMAASRSHEGHCRFRVEIKNELRPLSNHPDRTFTRLVDVILPGETIRLSRGKRVFVSLFSVAVIAMVAVH